ncbi:hypothetical protein CW748_09185 [Alteromonadales bacterium alter-6D02]|nr:hypothetical protein CW748_09185 [Alteromonadales bacterium alter-6D02]
MNTYLNHSINELDKNNAVWTAKEIQQQPDSWLKAVDIINTQQATIDAWLKPLLAQSKLRIILTGAGTSAYVGETIAPALTQSMARQVEAISTTDLVGSPHQYLLKDTPTLLVSFARSGNSPESVAAVSIADQLVDNCFHLIITCNEDGALAKQSAIKQNQLCLLMPEETLDKSFAMTSSFTSMMLSTLYIFAPNKEQLANTIAATRYLLEHQLDNIKQQAHIPFERIAFLGSGALKGIATEAALKMLELTAGQVNCYAESPLGFRHGPKSLVDSHTMVILLGSNDPYCQRYDSDLAIELNNDKKTEHLYYLTAQQLLGDQQLEDVWLAFPFIVYCQILAFYKSLVLTITPDNPCPSGEVNRVVQGVVIHPLKD